MKFKDIQGTLQDHLNKATVLVDTVYWIVYDIISQRDHGTELMNDAFLLAEELLHAANEST